MTTTDRLPALPFLAPGDRRRCLDEEAPARRGQFLLFDDGPTVHRLLAIEDRPLRVGRGLSADVRLDDPMVSRRHATLVRRGTAVRLHDDNSTNGTFVNGRRVSSVDLVDGDVVSFGRLSVIYRDATPVGVAAAA